MSQMAIKQSLQAMGLGPILMDSTAGGFDYLNPSPYVEHDPYIASILALCILSVGNITVREYMFEASGKVPIDKSSSFISRSRLDICEDFTNSLQKDEILRGLAFGCLKWEYTIPPAIALALLCGPTHRRLTGIVD